MLVWTFASVAHHSYCPHHHGQRADHQQDHGLGRIESNGQIESNRQLNGSSSETRVTSKADDATACHHCQQHQKRSLNHDPASHHSHDDQQQDHPEESDHHSCPVCDVISQFSGLIVAKISALTVSRTDSVRVCAWMPSPCEGIIQIASRGPPEF